jgi:hypothetical protein
MHLSDRQHYRLDCRWFQELEYITHCSPKSVTQKRKPREITCKRFSDNADYRIKL